MKKIDLHIHTTYSDGLLSPEQVLKLAKEKNYDVISITDHDTIDGYNIAKEIAEDYDIKLIPGVEISSNHRGLDVHILAYNFDTNNRKFSELLHTIYKGRLLRAKKIVKKLNKMGFDIEFNEVNDISGENNLIGRPHIARVLVNKGYCYNTHEVFNKYLGQDRPANIPKPVPSTKKVIKAIHDVNGIAVLAHPYTLKNDRVFHEIINMDIDGLEVFNTKCSDEMIEYYNNIALEKNLIRTGGSDFHGDGLDLDLFGEDSVPEFVLDELEYFESNKKWMQP